MVTLVINNRSFLELVTHHRITRRKWNNPDNAPTLWLMRSFVVCYEFNLDDQVDEEEESLLESDGDGDGGEGAGVGGGNVSSKEA